MNQLDVLIDTDNGLGTLGADPEDGLAIMMALRSPELRVRAITTVFGNCHLDAVNANTALLLRELGRSDVPVGSGLDAPLLDHPAGHPSPAREDDAQLVPGEGAARHDAIELIIETARAHPGVTLIALGPLTNVGLAFRLHRELKDLIGELVVMGGGARESNVTPLAEFNIWADPAAAHLAFSSGVPVRMVGLDVCHRVLLEPSEIDSLSGGGVLADLTQRCFRSLWWSPIPLFDTLTVSSLIQPELLSYMQALVTIDHQPGPGYGQTCVMWRNVRSQCRVAMGVDVIAFKRLFEARVLAPLRPAPERPVPSSAS